VLSLDFSSDSEWIVCGHQGGQIVIWDITQGKPIKSITDAHRNPVVLVRFLKTKDRILSVDNTVRKFVSFYFDLFLTVT
jgi:WD40 repeat protein